MVSNGVLGMHSSTAFCGPPVTLNQLQDWLVNMDDEITS